MTNWQSPTELVHDATAFANFMHVLTGLYIWEFVTSLSFDWSFISGKRVFRWPLIFYFLGRYSLLGALVGILVALNVTSEVNCQALYTVNQLLGNAAIGAASINLSIRTIAVWSQSKWVIFPIIAVILGHWSLLLHGILLKAIWVPGEGCQITETSNTLLAATFIYTMIFDLIVLSLTAWKLALAPAGGRSRLVTLIFGDGLIYFVIAFGANALATTFMLLNLNAVMSIIFNVPAAVASTIMACRAVRRLTKFTTARVEVFESSGQNSGIAFRNTTRGGPTTVSIKRPTQSGVHVQMDTFTMQDNDPQMNGQSFLEYDVNGNPKGHSQRTDIEAQDLSDEFKRPPYY